MDPELWGPDAWTFIHSVALTYPVDPTMTQKEGYRKFFTSLVDVLPCSICGKNYERHLVKHPLEQALKSRTTLFRWSVDMHNEVNLLNGKKIVSYDEALALLTERMESRRVPGNVKEAATFPPLVVMLIILVICFTVTRRV